MPLALGGSFRWKVRRIIQSEALAFSDEFAEDIAAALFYLETLRRRLIFERCGCENGEDFYLDRLSIVPCAFLQNRQQSLSDVLDNQCRHNLSRSMILYDVRCYREVPQDC